MAFMIQVNSAHLQESNERMHDSYPQELSEVLHEYQDLFQLPHGLPPKRSCDHKIPLLDELATVSRAPYCHSLLQKQVIEQ
jgi:hypothetical protein